MSRPRRDLLLLFALSLAVRLLTAALITRPGYMDTAYYAAGAVRLGRDAAWSEPFLWHYLDDPAGLPHPAFTYWMPLPSLLAAPLAWLFPGSFFALQIPFVLLSALLPALTYFVAWQATRRRGSAWLAGLLMLFSGFFFPYWTLPETFAPYALVGGLALWLAGGRAREQGSKEPDPMGTAHNQRWKSRTGDGARASGPSAGETPALRSIFGAGWWFFAAGALAGLAHLTRADGPLVLVVVLLAAFSGGRSRPIDNIPSTVYRLLSTALGYLLITAPWFARNLAVVGAPLSPAGTRTLWLTAYDDLFCYRCDLSLSTYLAWGWDHIVQSKLWALGVNLQRFLAEDCVIVLLPLAMVGFYRLRRHPAFVLTLVYLLLALLAHSLAFTFPGPRGGFFHASAAALPFLFAAAVEGLDAALGWAARKRHWNRRQAQWVFSAAVLAAAVALSLSAAAGKLPAWRQADAVYQEIDDWLTAHAAPDSVVVMVGNPPAFWYHAQRTAVVVPNGNLSTLFEAAARYDVSFVVLDANHPAGLGGLYRRGQAEGLELVATWGQVQLYRFEERR